MVFLVNWGPLLLDIFLPHLEKYLSAPRYTPITTQPSRTWKSSIGTQGMESCYLENLW